MNTPDRSLEQRLDALERANEVRFARANLKRTLHDTDRPEATRCMAAIVRDVPPWVATMHVGELLLALPGVGPVKVAAVLRKLDISPHKTLAGLSAGQRSRLVRWLRAFAGTREFPATSAEYTRRTKALDHAMDAERP